MTILLDGLRVLSHAATLVDGVDLELTPGTSTALVGASGAGKSLTCAALAGLLPPNLQVSGSLTVTDGQDDGAAPAGPNLLPIPAAQRPRGARIALVPQDP
ncbi:ATP-binding cassette domain-containing protein, partial [Actinomyces slackii]